MALFRRRRFIAEDDRVILQFDAELTVLRSDQSIFSTAFAGVAAISIFVGAKPMPNLE